MKIDYKNLKKVTDFLNCIKYEKCFMEFETDEYCGDKVILNLEIVCRYEDMVLLKEKFNDVKICYYRNIVLYSFYGNTFRTKWVLD